ncbi:MAG TPA: SDR family NAD(P)-dependent oxidoreductase [Burkholderiaceae bacterium]
MHTHLYIVTGSSRGMGEAIARQLIAPGHKIIGIARGKSTALAELGCEQWQTDLAEPLAAARQLEQWLAGQRFGAATLINNAGLIGHLGPVDQARLEDLSSALRVGLEATLLLSSAFLRATRPWQVPLRILNISSGLGRRAMAASAVYCAAKAGMDNLSAAMALDEAQQPDGARIVSLAPGVIDTDMQVQLRGADPQHFPDQQNFIGFKTSGQLLSPEAAAERVLHYLARPDFGARPIADVREA